MFPLKENFKAVETKFKVYQELCRGVATGKVRHLFVRGDGGIGKSHEANAVFEPLIRRKLIRVAVAKGHSAPLGLFNSLHEHRGRNEILMLDDCDAAFTQAVSLNLLKAATDTNEPRVLSWNSTTTKSAVERFQYMGSLIVLTNVDMRANKKYDQLLDRVMYYDLCLTPEEKTARVIWVLQHAYKTHVHFDEVCTFLMNNHTRLGEGMSIRAAVKLLELASFSRNWEALAEASVLPKNKNEEVSG